MYEMIWGIPKLTTKWKDLFKAILPSKESHLSNIKVVGTKIMLTDGRQCLQIEREMDWDIKPGFYQLSQQGYFMQVPAKVVTELKYPTDFDSILNVSKCDRTATIEFGSGLPLVALTSVIDGLGVVINLDLFCKAFAAIDALAQQAIEKEKGSTVIAYSYQDKEVSKDKNLVFKCVIGSIHFDYAVMPLHTKPVVTFEDLPLFEKKAS